MYYTDFHVLIIFQFISVCVIIAVLYNNRSLFIVFGADNLGTLRNDFFVLDIVNWQWVSDYKVKGDYPSPSVNPSGNSMITNNPTTSPAPINTNNESSAANANNQIPIPFNYVKTGYLIAVVTIIFTLL